MGRNATNCEKNNYDNNQKIDYNVYDDFFNFYVYYNNYLDNNYHNINYNQINYEDFYRRI